MPKSVGRCRLHSVVEMCTEPGWIDATSRRRNARCESDGYFLLPRAHVEGGATYRTNPRLGERAALACVKPRWRVGPARGLPRPLHRLRSHAGSQAGHQGVDDAPLSFGFGLSCRPSRRWVEVRWLLDPRSALCSANSTGPLGA